MIHPDPSDFEDPAALTFANAVGHGDVAAALAAGKLAPGGLNTAGKNGGTGLWIAVNRRDTAMVRALIGAGANPNGAPGYAPIHAAAREQDASLLRLLLSLHADPNATMGSETALYEAALVGWMEGAGILLDAGADIDRPDEVATTPLVVAASANHWLMAEFLLEHGANPFKDANGLTVADFARSSRILPASEEGAALPKVIERLKQDGSPWPPPNAPEVRTMKLDGRWPPKPH